MQSLVARWKPGSDPAIEAPSEIRWSDGNGATLSDYVKHPDEMHEIRQDAMRRS